MTNNTITMPRGRLTEKLRKAYEWGYEDGQNNPNEQSIINAEPVLPAVETVQGHHPSCRAVDEYKPGDCSHGCASVPPAGGEPEVVDRQCFPSEEMAQELLVEGLYSERRWPRWENITGEEGKQLLIDRGVLTEEV